MRHYQYASKVTVTWTLNNEGDLTCTAKPSSGGIPPHASHAECLPGCDLDDALTKVVDTHIRTLHLTPIQQTVSCTTVSPPTQHELIVGHERQHITETETTQERGGLFCNCEEDLRPK